MTLQGLKENLSNFMEMDKERQSNILGELLYPMVKENAREKALAPKITGMLIDFDVFEVSDILEFLETPEDLKERVSEAEDLIKNSEAE